MIGVASLSRLATELLGLPDGEVRGVVVDDPVRSVSVLVDATAAARKEGVTPGMRVLDAQQHAPSLSVDVIAAQKLHAELRVVAEVLLACSPVVEPVFPDAVALDLTGMVRPLDRIALDVRRACARLGHQARVVVSPGTRLSLALARAGRDDVVTEVEAALRTLPVAALSLPADLTAALTALGVRTAADLARLLPKGGVERLGEHARAVLDVLEARPTPLRGVEAPLRIAEEMDLDHPLTSLEPLAFLLNRLCSRLLIRIRARRQRLAELSLTMRGRGGDHSAVAVAFPSPVVDDKAALRALSVRLERHRLTHPVDRLELLAVRLASRAPRQLSLLEGASVHAEEALVGLLAEMAAELGAERVGCLVVTDEPLPERMTRLAWPPPPPPPRPPAPKRRRPRKVEPLPEGAVTSGGRFLASWPWPLRLLPRPARLDKGARVTRRELLGVLEGDDKGDAPYARSYELLVLADGRRALALHDDELEEDWLCGWFD